MSLNKVKKAELQKMYEQKGFTTTELTRAELLKLLSQSDTAEGGGSDHDDDQPGNESEGSDDGENEGQSEVEEESEQEQDGEASVVKKLLLIQAEAKKLKLQIELAKLKGTGKKVERASSRDVGNSFVKKLPVMTETDDVLSWFATLEKVAKINNISEKMLVGCLPSLLNNSLRTFYSKFDYDVCASYTMLKENLLECCKLTAKTYLSRFRNSKRVGNLSWRQHLHKLTQEFGYFLDVSGIKTFESLVDAIIMEQLSNSLPVEVRAFVESRSPKSAKDVASLADLHFDCNRELRQSNNNNDNAKHPPNNKFKKRFQPQGDHESKQTPQEGGKSNANALSSTSDSTESPAPKSEAHKKNVICFVCNESGHVASWHRRNAKESKLVFTKTPEVDILQYQKHNFIIPCYVFGKQVTGLKDSGAQITLIDESILEQNPKYIKTMPVKSVFGEIRPLHVLEIEISSPHFDTEETLKIQAGVTKNLSPPLLLGNDFFAKYPSIFSRRESDAANDNKIINSSRSKTPAPRAEVEPAEESSEIEARAVVNPTLQQVQRL